MKVPPPKFDRNVYALGGLPFDALDVQGAIKLIRLAAANRERLFFSTPNLNFLANSLRDETFRNSVIDGDLNVADGMPLVWMARLLRVPLLERIAGATLFEVLQKDHTRGIKVYFFGGKDGVAEMAAKKLNDSNGGARCVGFETPGFGSIEQMSSDETIERINASGADFLVVALGAKKGNTWIEYNLPRLNVPVVSHLGAVINFVAGTISRSPHWLQRLGFEWIWRIKEEPELWRRYWDDGKLFIHLLFTRVLPYAWFLRTHHPKSNDFERATTKIDIQAQTVEMTIIGAWSSKNIGPLRESFKNIAAENMNIKLNMSRVTYVDSAVIGLILLLYGYQRQTGHSLSLVSVSNSVGQIFKWNYVEYLLAD